MPITPLADGFLSEEKNEEYENSILLAVDAIEEIRNKGSEIFTKFHELEQKFDYAFLVQALYLRKLIELIDSIAILTKAKSNCDSLLRSYFECVVYITHLLEKETYNRSLAFIYTRAVNREISNNKFRLNTASGKETLSALKKEGKSTMLDQYADFIEQANVGLEMLKLQAEFKNIDREYNKLKKNINSHSKQKNKRPEWYYLFGGSKCFKDLSIKLGFKAKYDIMFEMLSEAAHAQDIIEFELGCNEYRYKYLRNSKEYIISVNFIFLSSYKIFESYLKIIEQSKQLDDISKWGLRFSLKYRKVLESNKFD